MKNLIPKLGVIAAISVLIAACGGGGGGGDDGYRTGGPASTASFVGSSFSFNPLMTFLPGGVVEYVNFETAGVFPYSPTTETGTYSYIPNSDYLSGTLIYTIPALTISETVELTDFVTSNGYVRSFIMTFDVEGSYTAYVTEGQIAAAGPLVGGDDDDDDGSGSSNGYTFGPDGNLAAGSSFQKVHLSSVYPGDSILTTWSPMIQYPVGTVVTFTIAESGNLLFPGRYAPMNLAFESSSNGIITWRGTNPDYGISSTDGFTVATLNTNTNPVGEVLVIRWTATFATEGDNKTFGDVN